MANGNNNFEATLFNTADRLRKNIDAAEYKNVLPRVYAKPNLDKSSKIENMAGCEPGEKRQYA